MANRARTRIENLRLAELEPEDLIAPNFRLYELTKSELASHLGIDNRFSGDTELRATVYLACTVLQSRFDLLLVIGLLTDMVLDDDLGLDIDPRLGVIGWFKPTTT
jgi:hypothetical protein